jgi:preprotein translocase subunit YajC
MAPPPPNSPNAQPTAPTWTSFVPILLMIVVFYFILIRPQQKRAKAHQKMLESIDTGDEVITVGGIVGVVANRKDKTIILKIAENVKIEVLKSAIQSVRKADSTTPTGA